MPSSLRSRLALLLILANLPAAVLAIGATMKGRATEVGQRQLAMVQRAEVIATRAGLTLGIAEGVADTLAANPQVASAGPDCAQHLKAALVFRPEYTGIVVAGETGGTLCSFGDTTGISGDGRSALMRAIQNTRDVGDTVFLPERIPPEDDVVLMSRAFSLPDGQRRAVGLLLRRDVFNSIFLPSEPGPPEESALALIRGNGVIVSEFLPIADGRSWQPEASLPVTRPGEAGIGVIKPTADGVKYHYAIAPVRGTLASVVLATPLAIVTETDWMRFATALAAPLLMLLLGIAAVFAGLDRLVLRWIARFRQVTTAYARGDYAPRIGHLERAPLELSELGDGINHMAARVQERSTALEDAVDGKNALLRELHHRVKNNFQMIASLLALQRRELPTRLRTLLRVPEDRVLAMAAAYKASYATGEIGHVSALDLLRDVTAQLRQSFGLEAPLIQTGAEDEPVWLDLDQAVPLGLLVSEILTSALDRADGGAHPIRVSVLKPDPRTVHVEITSHRIADAIPSTGLAARLVAAYRAQLNASVACPEDGRVVIAMPLERDAQNHPGRVELGA